MPDQPRRRSLYSRFNRFLERRLPSGLYQRALIILIAPMVLLQTIMAGIILDRHWDQVTKALSRALASEIGLMIALYEDSAKTPAAVKSLERLIDERLKLKLTVEPGAALPPPLPAPLISPVDRRLTHYLENETGRPFWIDTSGKSGFIDIRVEVEKGLVFRVLTQQERASAESTGVFLAWMLGSSLLLLGIAVVFLRNQILPIVALAQAAKNFGLGRATAEFRPRGASEVREAGEAFLGMQQRLARHVEQRTAMLAGVSHDLRTVLTRFKLEIAFLGAHPRAVQLKEDVEEMQHMLEAYMAFVRGDGGETAGLEDIGALLRAVAASASRGHNPVAVRVPEGLVVRVKPNAFRRLMANIIANAVRHARNVEVTAGLGAHLLSVTVDDDGPGIPAEQRAEVFKPFVRLDHARNQDQSGTGLGLAIALDIARAHGGGIALADSPLGGLRAVVEIPD